MSVSPLTYRELLDKLLVTLPTLPEEKILLTDAVGRVTTRQILATKPLPGVIRSRFDGFAVSTSQLQHLEFPVTLPIINTIFPEDSTLITSPIQGCYKIMTGGTLPSFMDAVIPWEKTQAITEQQITLSKSINSGNGILAADCDLAIGVELIAPGKPIKPLHISILPMQGITEIWVKQQPRITLLNTGTELVDTTDGENSHSFNALMLAELINKYGGVCHDQQILPDKTDILLKEISRASKNCDLLVITGGSGDGIHDVTKKILKKLATQVLIQHPAIHPASSFGAFVVNKCPVLHFPGTPAAAHLCSEVFLRPLIASFLQLDDPLWHLIHLESKIVSKLGKTTFHPLRLLRKNDRFSAVILDKQQGFYQQLLTMDGYLRIPAEVTDANIGEIHPII